jgi:hypothetical protein
MLRNKRIGQKSKTRFKTASADVITGLSRDVIVYSQDLRSECPNCYYDKVTNRSSGIPKVGPSDTNYFTTGRCPVCKGQGVITTSRRKSIKALVTWDPSSESLNSLSFNEGGILGNSTVQIKTDPCYLDLIKNCKKIVVDGIECRLHNVPIIRGLGNKSVLVSILYTEDKPKQNSGEYI